MLKEEIFNACSGVVVAGVIAGSALIGGNAQAAPSSYDAKVNEDGKFCAKVEISVGNHILKREKCRTLEEWKAKGYVVTDPATQETL